jgi:hypothetical protein
LAAMLAARSSIDSENIERAAMSSAVSCISAAIFT